MSVQKQTVHEQYAPRPKALFVKPDIHSRLKKASYTYCVSMQNATEEAVEEWLAKKEKEQEAES
ncbi:hypothetical protein [Sedimenticola hydrogenitrophicus]|uniref:hypothetical protein n=1 Tax=Sedimenticola hydrogenitrophicus TaxID=2967975 RepID=UPI0023B04B4F|nr:hypothetical protein [Sedimenticola hydrogenitrophicus]